MLQECGQRPLESGRVFGVQGEQWPPFDDPVAGLGVQQRGIFDIPRGKTYTDTTVPRRPGLPGLAGLFIS
jgi:hypothetical protein